MRAMEIRMRSSIPTLVLACTLTVPGACGWSQPSSAEISKWKADSAAYDTALAQYLRDSTVIDSLARAVPVDSLRKLFRALARDRESATLESAVLCEMSRLDQLYGLSPSDIAIERVLKETRVPEPRGGSRVLRLAKDCVLPEGPRPASFGRTSLRYPISRPFRPRRP